MLWQLCDMFFLLIVPILGHEDYISHPDSGQLCTWHGSNLIVAIEATN